MIKKWFDSISNRPIAGVAIVRIVIAVILGVHAIHGLIDRKALNGFGKYLGSIGFPFGVGFAWSIMLIQLACSSLMVHGKLIVPACIGHIIILSTGIVPEHAPKGWFVVGPGRNGMEYSVVLIACLFAILWAYWPRQKLRVKKDKVKDDRIDEFLFFIKCNIFNFKLSFSQYKID